MVIRASWRVIFRKSFRNQKNVKEIYSSIEVIQYIRWREKSVLQSLVSFKRRKKSKLRSERIYSIFQIFSHYKEEEILHSSLHIYEWRRRGRKGEPWKSSKIPSCQEEKKWKAILGSTWTSIREHFIWKMGSPIKLKDREAKTCFTARRFSPITD